MKKYILRSKINLTFIFLLFSTLFCFGQASITMYETNHFEIKRVSIAYNYKSKDKKIVSGTKFSHYQLFSKDKEYQVNIDSTKNRFDNIQKYDKINDCFQVQKAGKWGVLNLKTGKLIIDISHKGIQSLDDQFFIVLDKKQQVYNLDGTKLIEFEFQDVRKMCDLLYDHGSKDLILFDLKGNKKAFFPSTKITSLYGKEIVLRQKGKFGVINKEGEIIVPFEYDDAFFGNQFLSLGKLTKEGMKYKLFQNSQLKETILNGEFDYIKDCSIIQNDSIGNGFLILNRKTNSIQLLKENNEVFMQFNQFENGSKAQEFVENFQQVELFYDYVIVENYNEMVDVYCSNGNKFSNDQFYYFSTLDDGFEGYVFFIKEDQETVAAPKIIGNGKMYTFPFEIFSISKLSDQAYLINTDVSDNIFRPNAKNYILNQSNKEMYLDFNLMENLNLVILSDFNKDFFGYDILKDSVFIQNTKSSNEANQKLLEYVKWSIAPCLDSFNLKLNHPIKELIQLNFIEKGKKITQYTDENNEIIADRVPFRFDFIKSTNVNEGTFFVSSIEAPLELYYILSTVLDSKLNVIAPFNAGFIEEIRVLKNDTLVLFKSESDTMSIYSCHNQKMIYHSTLEKLTGGKNFYSKLTPFGIMNEFSKKNGLMDYSGKILVPFEYEHYENEGFEMNPNPVLDFVNSKGIHRYYFVNQQKFIEGCKTPGDLGIINERLICLPTAPNQYQIFHRENASLVFQEKFSDLIFTPDNERAIIILEDVYGLFDFKNNLWLENMKFSEEEFYKIYDEKYLK